MLDTATIQRVKTWRTRQRGAQGSERILYNQAGLHYSESLKKDLKKFPYRIQANQMLTADDKRRRWVMAEALMEKVQFNKYFLPYFITFHVAHFYLDSNHSPDLSPQTFSCVGVWRTGSTKRSQGPLQTLRKNTERVQSYFSHGMQRHYEQLLCQVEKMQGSERGSPGTFALKQITTHVIIAKNCYCVNKGLNWIVVWFHWLRLVNEINTGE